MDRTHTILIVDDDEGVRSFLGALCTENGYEAIFASDGKEGLEVAESAKPDTILIDAMMPVMDGFDAIRRMRSREAIKHVPIIMLTGELKSKENMLKGIEVGANDFLTKPVENRELLLRIQNNLKVKEYHDLLERYNSDLEQRVEEKTRDLQTANTHLKESFRDTIHKLTLVAEYRDEGTGEHIVRIGVLASELAESLGCAASFVENIYYAAPMHDIGKVGVPDAILLKTGKLTEEEWEIMKGHTTIGEMVLKDSDSPYLDMARRIAATHHERWDGSGYPAGLRGEQIPLEGRIVNIVDQYDALRTERPYKPAFNHEEVMEILVRGDGRTSPGHFDPLLLSKFKETESRFAEIYRSRSDREKDYVKTHVET